MAVEQTLSDERQYLGRDLLHALDLLDETERHAKSPDGDSWTHNTLRHTLRALLGGDS